MLGLIRKSTIIRTEIILLCVITSFVSACHSSSSPKFTSAYFSKPEATTVALTIESGKVFRFNWADVEGATFYRLLENPDGDFGFIQVGEDISAGTTSLTIEVPRYARTNAQYLLSACNDAGCTDSNTIAMSDELVTDVDAQDEDSLQNEAEFLSCIYFQAYDDEPMGAATLPKSQQLKPKW